MPVEVDPQVGGEHEGEAAALLKCGFLVVSGEVGPYEGGVGVAEGRDKAVRGAPHGSLPDDLADSLRATRVSVLKSRVESAPPVMGAAPRVGGILAEQRRKNQ